jgi:pimeloyl-ACP methyl ester carboxylesterase
MIEPEPVIFTGADGNRLEGGTIGPAGGPLAILLHGGGQTWRSWLQTQHRLAEKGYRAVAYDARGHGDSQWVAPDQYELSDFARDLAAVVDQLGGSEPLLIGASLGGMTALLAVGEGILDGAAGILLADVVHRAVAQGADHIRAFMLRAARGFDTLEDAAEAISRYLAHRERPADLDALARKMRQDEAGRWKWAWDPSVMARPEGPERRRFESERLTRSLSKVQVPVLLLRGEKSEIVSPQLRDEFLGLLPAAEAVDVPGATHMVSGDDNDAFTSLIFDFIDRRLSVGA